jgi:DNA polymerase III epsilon subunit-like protein
MQEKNGKYIVLDLEMTGLLAGVNGIAELAAAVLDDKLEILETINFDVCPPDVYEINDYSLTFGNMTRERLALGKTYLETCALFTEFVDKHFSEPPTFVGQFFPADFSFLIDMYTKSGLREDCLRIFQNRILDTKAIANYINLKASIASKPLPFPITTSLSNPGGLKDTFGITGYESHTALGDVLATREALIHLLEM